MRLNFVIYFIICDPWCCLESLNPTRNNSDHGSWAKLSVFVNSLWIVSYGGDKTKWHSEAEFRLFLAKLFTARWKISQRWVGLQSKFGPRLAVEKCIKGILKICLQLMLTGLQYVFEHGKATKVFPNEPLKDHHRIMSLPGLETIQIDES